MPNDNDRGAILGDVTVGYDWEADLSDVLNGYNWKADMGDVTVGYDWIEMLTWVMWQMILNSKNRQILLKTFNTVLITPMIKECHIKHTMRLYANLQFSIKIQPQTQSAKAGDENGLPIAHLNQT